MAALEYGFRVTDFRMITPTVFELKFVAEPRPDGLFHFLGGQFISVVVPGAGPSGRDLRRAYSMASPPHRSPIEFCVKLVEEGPGSGYLGTLRPGARFRGFAPYGDFVYHPKTGRHACFVATGTGIAPFRSMALSEQFRAAPPKSTLCLLGVRTEDELLYHADLAGIPGVTLVETVTQPTEKWTGLRGRVTDYMRARSARDAHGADFPWLETEFYLCGNGAMISEMKRLLSEKQVPKDAIHQETYYK